MMFDLKATSASAAGGNVSFADTIDAADLDLETRGGVKAISLTGFHSQLDFQGWGSYF